MIDRYPTVPLVINHNRTIQEPKTSETPKGVKVTGHRSLLESVGADGMSESESARGGLWKTFSCEVLPVMSAHI
jgi:hypothetical protein